MGMRVFISSMFVALIVTGVGGKVYGATENGVIGAHEGEKGYISGVLGSITDKYDNYSRRKGELKQAKLDECVKNLEWSLPRYDLFLEKKYISVNRENEEKVIESYKKLKKKGVSIALSSQVNREIFSKISSAESTLEYMGVVLSGLRSIQRELREGGASDFSAVIKRVEFLMYGWTYPYGVIVYEEHIFLILIRGGERSIQEC